jgi:ATP synthase F1 gamma subunit
MPEQAKVIRKRIKSVSSTKKITRTMEMVATAKLKAAQGRVQSLGPYLKSLRELMRDIGASGVDVTRWPPFEVRPGKRTLLFVLTANRGLCGAFNANLIRLGRDTYREKHEAGHDVSVRVAGRKGMIAFRYLGIPTEKAYVEELPDQPTPDNVAFFVRELMQPFLDNEVDEVYIVYPHWISVGKQPPTLLKFLPIAPEEAAEKRHGVEPLYEPPFILVARHNGRGRSVPEISPAIVGIGAATAGYSQHDNGDPFLEAYGFNIGKRGRFYSSKHSGHVFQRLRRNLLPHYIARVGHAEEDKTTRAVEHAAGRLRRVGPLAGRACEFDTLGLAAENQFFQFVDIHTVLSVSPSTVKVLPNLMLVGFCPLMSMSDLQMA